MREGITEREARQAIALSRDRRWGDRWKNEGRIAFVRVVQTGKKVKRGNGSLDNVQPNTTTECGPQIQFLQRIGKKVGIDEPESARRKIVVIAETATDRIRRGVGEAVDRSLVA